MIKNIAEVRLRCLQIRPSFKTMSKCFFVWLELATKMFTLDLYINETNSLSEIEMLTVVT
jgi:hypothetical protein